MTPAIRLAMLGCFAWHALVPQVSTAAATATAPPADWARYVDPFIGTGEHGHTYPGATLPFGMVQLSPDTRLSGWDGCSGYHFSDSVIYGFSHTHLSGTGIPDYGDILFMPRTGKPRWKNGAGGPPGTGYGSSFDKSSERAEPGWYAVELTDTKIQVELTVTERAGFHRYRFPAGEPAHVLVDLAHRDSVLDAGLRIVSPSGIEGWRRSSAWARDQVVYFAARFSRPFSRATLATDDQPSLEMNELQGKSVKGIFAFGAEGGELLVKVGISAVDIDGARRNLETELPGWNFEAVRYAARLRWDEALGRIETTGGTEEQRVVFYTALYHSLLAPNLFSDVDGRYRGMDGAIHTAEDRRQYTVFSLWDTFRAAHPLYTLIEPERAGEFVATFLAQAEQGGRLPVWELAGNETDCMIGYHSVSVIADAWSKGIGGFDAERALDAMVHTANLDHFGLDAYKRQGFIGGEDEPESVSKTLEYAYDDWCIAQMAAGLGRDDVAREFEWRSQGWRHLFDPETRFLRPRRNQRWLSPFDPRRVDLNYTEANAWQYTFFVPHDVPGLMAAMGGENAFVAKLDSLFQAESHTTGREQADITGRIGQYAHGNEPSHHVAWLYHYAGRPDKSAERVRQILSSLYGIGPAGLCGNEDCGQLSSWYVLAAIGLYPVCPGANEYLVGAPLFDVVTLHLDDDRTFRILARGATQRPYIRSARLDGKRLERSFLRHQEIRRGKELVLELEPAPGSDWGRPPAARPGAHEKPKEKDIPLPAPFVRAASDVFADSLVVALGCADPSATLLCAREDPFSTPVATPASSGWTRTRKPFVLRQSTRLRLLAESGARHSPVVEAVFHRLPHRWEVRLETSPNPQYTAGGASALVDGLRGASNWRLGGWQGYQGVDCSAIVDLGTTQRLRRAGASFLQDVGSWIWMPAEVVISVSSDGRRFRQVARLKHEVPDKEYGIVQEDLTAELDGVSARYIKIVARNYGTIPAWHPGHGSGAFIFIDEILIE